MLKIAIVLSAWLAAGAFNIPQAQAQQQGQSAGPQGAAVVTAQEEQLKAAAGAANALQSMLKGLGQGQSAAAATQSRRWEVTMTCTDGAQCERECVRMQDLGVAVCQSRQGGCSCTFP
jgi:hypothetical protein